MADLDLNDNIFEEQVLKSKIPVVVDFWAPWCGPCRMVSPIIEELTYEYKDKVKVGKLNVDENTQTAGKYSIMSIPTVVIFKDGRIVKTLVGAQSKDVYKTHIENLLK